MVDFSKEKHLFNIYHLSFYFYNKIIKLMFVCLQLNYLELYFSLLCIGIIIL